MELDVRKPLKRRKKLIFASGKEAYVYFKYEKLTTFCFYVAKLGHGESYCPIRMVHGIKELPFGWDITMKVTPRRMVDDDNIWLRDVGGNWETNMASNEKGKSCSLGDSYILNFLDKRGVNLVINLNGK